MDDRLEQSFSLPDLRADLDALCDFGGRFAGTESELSARAYAEDRLQQIGNGKLCSIAYPYLGWRRGASRVELQGGSVIDATALVLSPPTPPQGLTVEVVDLGRGTGDDFERESGRLRGRGVLVRHEFPFTVRHVHRRKKYAWAKRAGVRAFFIANNLAGVGVVSGSSGRGEDDDIPAVGLSHEGGAKIASQTNDAVATVRLFVESQRVPMEGKHIVYELPGLSDEWVVVCAHLDGHDLAESALDNATGAAAVMEIGRRLAPLCGSLRRGLRLMLFTFEEWGLYGSSRYVAELSEDERRKIALVVNLDTICGSSRLSALISGMDDVGRFVEQHSQTCPLPVDLVRPVMANSDHYNFFMAGIPSFRLIAGYEDPAAETRFLLTPADTRARIDMERYMLAVQLAGRIAYEACSSSELVAAHLDRDGVLARLDEAGLEKQDPWVADRLGSAVAAEAVR